MKFISSSKSQSGIQNSWTSSASGFDVIIDIPKEFDGQGNGFSPEDIYALALQNCFIATFKVIAEKSKFEFLEIFIDLDLILDKNDNQQNVMKEAHFKIKLSGTPNKEKALRLLEKTTKSCMILNSVKTELFFNFEIEEL